jgi:2-polyprenyl-3-methyl-5-hydroxy-6-metoxy-1,4-benzoquinol methylase
MAASCQVCGSSDWWDLPNPVEGRSITTAGRIIEESLGKAHCAQCGFVQRIHAKFLGLTDYYEQDYAKYYDRPGTAQFHLERYRVFGHWMESVLAHSLPTKILDVGCGQGWAMQAMQELYPRATIQGLEPSHYNGRIAREKGFVVYETRAGEFATPERKYDLVYSNNVLQHVTNAHEFLVSLKEIVSKNGLIIVTCPDGSRPNIELLWSDQNFSFLPVHLVSLCKDIGFEMIRWFASPISPAVPPAQMLFLSTNNALRSPGDIDTPVQDLAASYRAKCDYLRSFSKISVHICAHLQRSAQVFNFGASYWSSVLAVYCPAYWREVSACIVDGTEPAEGEFLGKPLLTSKTVEPADNAFLVLGTSPGTHRALRARFSTTWKNIISWDDFLPY